MSQERKESVTYALIAAGDDGQRLDNYLVRVCKGVPKSHLYRIVRSGEVRVNSRRVDAAYRLQPGDQIRIPPLRLPQRPDLAEAEAVAGAARRADLPLLFEDEAMLVVDKPSGLAVHGGSGVSFGVIEALRHQRPEARFIELAHRLDRETSGILLVGKKRSALKALHDMFRDGHTDKRYLVLVFGDWPDPVKHVKLPLYKFLTEAGERRVAVDAESGRPAYTIFRLLRRGARFCLLEAQLKTGRTHQIRVHLAHLGFPIAGDEKYGDFAANKALQREGLKRMFLHAWRMRSAHPVSGETLSLEAPLPAELQRFIDALESRGELPRGKKI